MNESLKKALLCLCFTIHLNAQPLLADSEDIFWNALPSAVWIINEEDNATGSGAVVKESLVITAAHVVGDSTWVKVFFAAYDEEGELHTDQSVYTSEYNAHALDEQKRYSWGKVIAIDAEKDLAIVNLVQKPDSAQGLVLAADSPKFGQIIYILGNPGGRPLWRFSLGQVNYVGDDSWFYEDGQSVVAKSVKFVGEIFGGNSGGPLVNDAGELVGIVVASSSNGTPTAFAIDVAEVKELFDTIRTVHVVTISNTTKIRMPFSFRWKGQEEWEQKAIEVGYSRTFWSAGHEKAEIRFDRSYAEGYQPQDYDLLSNRRTRGNKITVEDGVQYSFQHNGSVGVELYKN